MCAYKRIGDDVVERIPDAFEETLGLRGGQRITLTFQDGALQIHPTPPRYTLAELLAQCDLPTSLSEEDRA